MSNTGPSRPRPSTWCSARRHRLSTFLSTLSPPRAARWGIATLLTTKAADLGTTLVALRSAGTLRESNPLAALAIRTVGLLPALVCLLAAAVAVIVVVTETGVRALDLFEDPGARSRIVVRAAGYGLPSLLQAVIVAHNLSLLASV